MQVGATRIAAILLAGLLLGGLAIYALLPGERGAEPTVATLASDWQAAPSSRLRLESTQSAVGDGYLLLGLHMELDEGWKTYWRNPGDSGLAPRFNWSGSNLKSVELLWPAPRAFDEFGGRYYGYTGSVVWPVRIAANDPEKAVMVSLKMDFGVCSDVCIPASIEAGLELPPGAAMETRHAAAIENALMYLPLTARDAGLSATLRLTGVQAHRAELEIGLEGTDWKPGLVIATGAPGTYFGASQPHGEKGFRVPLESEDPEALRATPIDLLFLDRNGGLAVMGLFFID